MRLLAAFAVPSGIALVLFVLGLMSACWWRSRRLTPWLLGAAGLVMVVFSSGMTAAALMSPLEYRYPTLADPRQHPEARHIVVLTGWATDDPEMPLTGRLGTSTTYRVLLALELHRDRPDCDVVVSGDPVTAKVMGESLVKLGVPATQLRLENGSTTTAESAAHLPSFVGPEKFFLVTSAGHMPRTLAVFAKAGLAAIPAPTDHQMPKDWRKAEIMPSPNLLEISDLAVHEYLGTLLYRMRDGA